jgi:hypothetical protein
MKGVRRAGASKLTAPRVEDLGVVESRSEHVGGDTVEILTFREDADPTPFFKGLPNDRCQRIGLTCSRTLKLTFADREETYEAGDAFYGPRGHIPRMVAGSEIVAFSPTEEYRRTVEVAAQNFAALQGG